MRHATGNAGEVRRLAAAKDRLHISCISVAPRLHLGCISAALRRACDGFSPGSTSCAKKGTVAALILDSSPF